MKVGIIQPNFVPWRGYFDFIREVDVFVFLDDVQYTKRDWRNRNRIKTAHGLKWITVPVHASRTDNPLIDETPIDNSSDWQDRLVNQIREAYREAPYLEPILSEFAQVVASNDGGTIAELDHALVEWLCQLLGIDTSLRSSRDLQTTGTKTDRLIEILKQLDATHYLSGPSAREYLDPAAFVEAGIALEFKQYDYPEYPQLHGPFESHVSILDLLLMTGPEAASYF